MAAVILPLAINAAPLIIPFISRAIVGIEHLFNHKPKQGALKNSLVTSMAKTLADALFVAGVVTSPMEQSQIETLTETVFQSLNSAGVVNNPANTAIAATAPMPTLGALASVKVTGTLNLG